MTYLYIQAEVSPDKTISFRNLKVEAKDKDEAYAKGFYKMNITMEDTTHYMNDYVVKVSE